METQLDGVTKSRTQLSDFPFTFHFHALEKEMATHSSVLVWRIPGTEEPGRLQSMGSQRVGHNWATSLSLFTFMHWRRKRQPTPVFLPGESQGWGNLVGCRLWGRKEWNKTEWLNWTENKQTNKKWNNDNQDIEHQERTVVTKRQGKMNWTLFWLNLQSVVHFKKKLRRGNICRANCFPVLRSWNLISGPPEEAWVHRTE